MALKSRKRKTDSSSEEKKAKRATAEKAWTAKDDETLISRLSKILPSPDNSKFSATLKKIQWSEIVFGNFSDEDCKRRWEVITMEIRKCRTLSEIIDDVKKQIKNPYKGNYKKHPDYPKVPLTPYFRYSLENRDEFAKKHSNLNNQEVGAELMKTFKQFSSIQKKKYVEEWKKEKEVYKVALKKFQEDHPSFFETADKNPKESQQSEIVGDDGQLSKNKKVSDLENEKHELERTVNELKAKCEAIEKREAERRQVEEKKHSEEIQFLKDTNQQLQIQLKRISSPKKKQLF